MGFAVPGAFASAEGRVDGFALGAEALGASVVGGSGPVAVAPSLAVLAEVGATEGAVVVAATTLGAVGAPVAAAPVVSEALGRSTTQSRSSTIAAAAPSPIHRPARLGAPARDAGGAGTDVGA